MSRLAALHRRPALAAALLGLASALALPPVFLVPVLGLTVPGLLALIGAAPSWRRAAWLGFCFGFAHHVAGLYWVTEAILVRADQFWWLVPFAAPGLALLLAPFIAASVVAAWFAPPGWRRVLVLAGAWTLADLARQFVGTGFPWNPWGSVWAAPTLWGAVMQQPAAWIGTPGLTLATVLVAALPALGRRGIAASLAILAVWAGLGAWRLGTPQPKPPGLTVALIQGDIPEGQKLNAAFAASIFNIYLDLTREAAQRIHGPGLIIWPEAASPYLLGRDANARAAITEAARGLPVFAGSIRFGADGRPRNTLYAIMGPGPPAARYDKRHLVPFGEYEPSWMPIKVLPGGGFEAGHGFATWSLPGLPSVGPLICYEAIFPDQVVDEARRPQWMVNVTNDAWFGNSTGPRQHLAAARLRAVEEGLPLVRAANSGISAVFDAFGHETARLGLEERGALLAALPGPLPPSLFARFGLAIPLGVAVLLLVVAIPRNVLFIRRPARF
jgi:apolipoprotein N-acyltransferase